MTPSERLIAEAAHLARATAYLLRQEAELIEAALHPEAEPQDDANVHHVRPGQSKPDGRERGLGKPTGRSPMGNVEHADFGGGCTIDWQTGAAAVFDDVVIAFPQPKKRRP